MFAAVAFRLMPSMNRILASIHSLRYGLPAVNTLYHEFKTAVPTKDTENNTGIRLKKTLSLRNLSYTYDEAKTPAVNNISININNGDSIGFIGTSGSGKSTLLDMVLGLLTPDTGNIFIDDVDIKQNLRNWQSQIGYVAQSIFLTDDTLRRNVAFGIAEDKIDNNAVWSAIVAAQLEQFIEDLPDKLETMVGERGVRLSGGQRQRIGIARALYHDPTVLILDEATSALDMKTEEEVMRSISALQGTKTILIVAHRLTTLKNCTQIVELEHGRIKKMGSYHEIIKSNIVANDILN